MYHIIITVPHAVRQIKNYFFHWFGYFMPRDLHESLLHAKLFITYIVFPLRDVKVKCLIPGASVYNFFIRHETLILWLVCTNTHIIMGLLPLMTVAFWGYAVAVLLVRLACRYSSN